jgi:transposase
MKERLTLSVREQKRIRVMNEVEKKVMRVREAAEVLGISERQGWRILAAYREEGAAGIAHGNRGRTPVHVLGEGVREQVVELARGRYGGFNHTHLTEMLQEREGLKISRPSVRRILQAEGMRSPKTRRSSKHRRRRERYPQEGMLIQVDGSWHDWLEGRGPEITLIASIDDATGKVPYALFREEEDAQGYFLLLGEIVRRKGNPLAIYHDRHGIFDRSSAEGSETLAEHNCWGKSRRPSLGDCLRNWGSDRLRRVRPRRRGEWSGCLGPSRIAW